jgi:hypothetical protein
MPVMLSQIPTGSVHTRQAASPLAIAELEWQVWEKQEVLCMLCSPVTANGGPMMDETSSLMRSPSQRLAQPPKISQLEVLASNAHAVSSLRKDRL